VYICVYCVCVCVHTYARAHTHIFLCIFDIQIKLINQQIATSNADNINYDEREAKRDKGEIKRIKKNYENR